MQFTLKSLNMPIHLEYQTYSSSHIRLESTFQCKKMGQRLNSQSLLTIALANLNWQRLLSLILFALTLYVSAILAGTFEKGDKVNGRLREGWEG